jgi:ribonuclease HI
MGDNGLVEKRKMIWGAESWTSVNRCELAPVMIGLRYIMCTEDWPDETDVVIMSDSEYTMKRLSDMAVNGVDSINQAVPGPHMWQDTYLLSKMFHSVRYIWVPRNSNYYNEFCDGMAGSIYSTLRNMLMELFGENNLDPSVKVDTSKPLPKVDI